MSGTVAVVAQETNRFTMFSICLQNLQHPPQTTPDWGMSTGIVPQARNTLVERALERGSDWLLFLDDDQVFPPDLLMNLLAWDVPIVSALYLRRAGHHIPVAFSGRRDDGLYEPLDLTSLPGEGLLKVRACGAGGLLIRTEVFREIPNDNDWFQYGQVGAWDASEDIVFCEKAHAAGYEVFVDLGSPIGHMSSAAVWPSFLDGEWCLGFSISDSTRLFAPIEKTADTVVPADAVRR